MTLELKRTLLSSLYRVYDEATQHFERACRLRCHTCCTQNVLCTTLEADLMVNYLQNANRSDLVDRIQMRPAKQILRPSTTLNELAGYCLRRQEPPEQHAALPLSPCIFLEDGACLVYAVRPFACRSLWSEQTCADRGEARMNPVLVSLNGVFEQTIEHIDQGGFYGNLLDLLSALVSDENRDTYRLGRPLRKSSHLLETRPSPGFLVPPSHRPIVIKALNRLWEQDVDGLSFREVLRQLR